MIQDHLQQLRSELEQTELPAGSKTRLLELLAAAESEASADTPEETLPEERGAINRLIASIDGMEAAHPKLTDLVNQLAMGLSKMGF